MTRLHGKSSSGPVVRAETEGTHISKRRVAVRSKLSVTVFEEARVTVNVVQISSMEVGENCTRILECEAEFVCSSIEFSWRPVWMKLSVRDNVRLFQQPGVGVATRKAEQPVKLFSFDAALHLLPAGYQFRRVNLRSYGLLLRWDRCDCLGLHSRFEMLKFQLIGFLLFLSFLSLLFFSFCSLLSGLFCSYPVFFSLNAGQLLFSFSCSFCRPLYGQFLGYPFVFSPPVGQLFV